MRALVITAILWVLFASPLAYADVITGIDFDVQASQTAIVISQSGQKAPKVFTLGGDTPRVVMDWSDANIGFDTGGLPELKGYGHVERVRYASQGATGLRIVLDLLPGAGLNVHNYEAGKLTIDVQGPRLNIVEPNIVTQEKSASRNAGNSVPYPRLKPQNNVIAAVKRRPIIVIDAGHGGRDSGAIGAKGTYEKTITLKASQELERQLSASGQYEVILTRSDDQYVDHEERIRIARAGKGDLFISVHADSIKSSSIRGASVYTLSDKSKKRSKGIVDSQNWIMDVDLTEQSDPVGDILVDLAQRKTSSQSELFADLLVSNLSQSTRLIGNTHRRAGYFVLLAPDVPAVLLELGFISNPQDEALMKTAAHRRKVMRSVVTAINAYFAHQKS